MTSPSPSTPAGHQTPSEWFAQPDTPDRGQGLRFQCTMCGNCCSGPPGFVLVSDDELARLAARFRLTPTEFEARYTHRMDLGRSLNEVNSTFGRDCVFLDRKTIPGKAICGVYEDRPLQCKTWPFWPSVIRSPSTWSGSKRTCPGIDKGNLIPVEQIRILRDRINI